MFFCTYSKPKKLFNIFDSLTSIYNDVSILIDKDEITIKEMDSSHTCYVSLTLYSEDFDTYTFKDTNQNKILISLNIKNLVSILNACKDGKYIELRVNDYDSLIIISKSDYDIKEFSLNLMNINCNILDVPDTDYNCVFKLTPDIFFNIIDTCSIMKTDIIDFSQNDKNLVILSNGELGNYKQVFESKEQMQIKKVLKINKKSSDTQPRLVNKSNYSLNCSNNNYKLQFALNMIEHFKKASKLTDIITLNLNPEQPLRIDYMINDETGSILYFYLAPKIDD